tara:strand:+ start:1195 stop:1524 length:330 start_codon:yes stop_codon:yes gene_type:complete
MEETDRNSTYLLSVLSTNLANDRTFLASIRTNAIFAGLSMILIKLKYNISAIIVLGFSIIANLLIMMEYVKNKKNKRYKESSLIYSAILLLTLFILFYTSIIQYMNIKK